MIKLEKRPEFFIDSSVRVYLVFGDAEPYRVASRDLAEKYDFDHETLMNLIWHRVRHKKGLLGNTVIVSGKSTGGRPVQERLLNIRQANDLLFDLLPAHLARTAMTHIRKSVLVAGKMPYEKLDPIFEEKVRSRIIYYLAKERTRAGISQNGMARRIGVSTALLCQWLKDGYPIDRSAKTDRIVSFACGMFPDLLQPDTQESEVESAEDIEYSRTLERVFRGMRRSIFNNEASEDRKK